MIWALLIIYQIKHFICDYPLQGKYMLGKFKPYPDYIGPLLAHSAVHGLATFLIAWHFKSLTVAILIGLLDMSIHFTVDRIKASPDILGKFKALSANEMRNWLKLCSPNYKWANEYLRSENEKEFKKALKSNTLFWWSLGADQFAHHLTHYLIIWILL